MNIEEKNECLKSTFFMDTESTVVQDLMRSLVREQTAEVERADLDPNVHV